MTENKKLSIAKQETEKRVYVVSHQAWETDNGLKGVSLKISSYKKDSAGMTTGAKDLFIPVEDVDALITVLQNSKKLVE
jgi:hypothetical protein